MQAHHLIPCIVLLSSLCSAHHRRHALDAPRRRSSPQAAPQLDVELVEEANPYRWWIVPPEFVKAHAEVRRIDDWDTGKEA